MFDNFLFNLIVGAFIGATAGYLGSLMLAKKMTLVAGPLGHLTLPGIALALIYGFDISLGAFPFVILGIVLIWLLEMKTRLPIETLVAIVFASGAAIAFLFLPLDQAEEALVGDISKIGFSDGLGAILLSLLVFLAVFKIYPQMTLINISEDLAKVEKINVKKYKLFYLGCIALIVALGVKLVGGLLTAALIALPAASARNLSRNLKNYQILAPLLGAISVLLGSYFFYLTALPAGPLIILISTLFFLLSVILK